MSNELSFTQFTTRLILTLIGLLSVVAPTDTFDSPETQNLLNKIM
jgi:hypothetical protein